MHTIRTNFISRFELYRSGDFKGRSVWASFMAQPIRSLYHTVALLLPALMPFAADAAPRYSVTVLGTLEGNLCADLVPYSEGYSLNNSGHAVGTASAASCKADAFIWNGSELQDLNPAIGGAAYGINESGVVTGETGGTLSFTTVQCMH
jgi:hypothetical protein